MTSKLTFERYENLVPRWLGDHEFAVLAYYAGKQVGGWIGPDVEGTGKCRLYAAFAPRDEKGAALDLLLDESECEEYFVRNLE